MRRFLRAVKAISNGQPISMAKMHYYRALIQYDGTGYAGFQWQQDAVTIQSALNQALSNLISGKFSTLGASRTDTGVHAHGQVVKVTSENALETATFAARLNQQLPSQIRMLHFESCSGLFNPSTAPLSKEYRYLFTNQQIVAEENRRFIANMAVPLNTPDMHRCIEMIRGKHDFCNFTSTGSNVKTTIREVQLCELSEINPQHLFARKSVFPLSQDITQCYQLRIEANGFLKQMIRHLVAALWMVGSGKMSRDEFELLLNGAKVDKQLWKLATPKGLHLIKINY